MGLGPCVERCHPAKRERRRAAHEDVRPGNRNSKAKAAGQGEAAGGRGVRLAMKTKIKPWRKSGMEDPDVVVVEEARERRQGRRH